MPRRGRWIRRLWIPYAALLAGVAAAAVLWVDHLREERLLQEKGNRGAAVAARLLQRPLWNLEMEDLAAGLDALLLDPDVVGVEVRDAGGVVAARWEGSASSTFPTESEGFAAFERPIVHRGRPIGTLRLVLSPRRPKRRLLAGAVLALLAVGLGTAGLLAYIQVLVAQWVRNRRFSRRLARHEIHNDLILESLGASTYLATPEGRVLFRRGPLVAPATDGGRWGDWILPEDRPAALRWFRERVTAGEAGSREYRIRGSSGQVRWVRDWVRPQGRRVFGLVADVTEARRAAEQRRSLERQMAEAQRMESMGRLASGLAHDFRNLLHVVRGHLDLLEQGLPPERCLPAARDGLDQASRLLQSLLALARTDIPRSAVSVADVLEQAATLARPALGSGIRLELAPQARPTVDAAPGELQQALLNLIMNAKDALGQRGTIRLGVDTAEDDQGRRWAVVTVADDGPGIPPDVLPHIFQPFFTTKPPGIGTGLGLAMVERIVHLHGGEIEVDSRPGRGTEFRIRLPLSPPVPVVWVLAEDPVRRRALARAVERAGFRPRTAADPEEVRRGIREEGAPAAIVAAHPRWNEIQDLSGSARLLVEADPDEAGSGASAEADRFPPPLDPAALEEALVRLRGSPLLPPARTAQQTQGHRRAEDERPPEPHGGDDDP